MNDQPFDQVRLRETDDSHDRVMPFMTTQHRDRGYSSDSAAFEDSAERSYPFSEGSDDRPESF